MTWIDWLVLGGTQLLIIIYGIWRSRQTRSMQAYFLSDRSMSWGAVCVSIMATQASAITFLSVPGQAYDDGLRLVQMYYGLPLAMVVLAITAVPIFHKLNVYTAYEYLETRFDLKTRTFCSILFLTQRGLSTGFSIYAPSLVLSAVLGWDIFWLNLFTGGFITIYTMTGGAKAVAQTQQLQMLVITIGMTTAGVMAIYFLPESVGFGDVLEIAGKSGRLNPINFQFDWNDRYTVWSGILGGFFLYSSYFGADQSQVQRYLGGSSIKESRMGLLANGLLKIPMQVLILLVGIFVYVFFHFYNEPLIFNSFERSRLLQSPHAETYKALEARQDQIEAKRRVLSLKLTEKESISEESLQQIRSQLSEAQAQQKALRLDVARLSQGLQLGQKGTDLQESLIKAAPKKDLDYVFINFILSYLPVGVVGLLISVVLSASMSSAAGALSALASTTVIDGIKRFQNSPRSDKTYVWYSRLSTLFWGIVAVAFAQMASGMDNLIQAVNVMGSLVYGTILGIFVVAFYFKSIGSHAVFWAALLAESCILYLYFFERELIAFLWYNPIGCILVIAFGYVAEHLFFRNKKETPKT
ncbi:MAG: sodium:solute symporter [Cytophagales bacterium]|nr:MAG: sodium:solute symporter [Cytophagales bacterium]TAF61120.1 MAG: sodium:solute symporter [Cytophagales bacterium]